MCRYASCSSGATAGCSPTAASTTPRSAEPVARVAVAYSGGRDSTALLHATLAVAAGSNVGVLALHVHHGLTPHADAWLAHCEAQCVAWAKQGHALEFAAHRLTQRPPPGASVEAWARKARYRALTELARRGGADLVLLAHHRRDQAETLLLQALRGAGVAGLAGMPGSVQRDGITWLRPWLQRPREEIEAYGRVNGIDAVEDQSNVDPRFARSRLRLQVWPALTGAFAHAETSLAMAAAWAHEADAALRDYAAEDMARVADGPRLDLAAWSALSSVRRSLTLRVWLKACTGVAPPAALVVRLLADLPASRSGHCVETDQGELRRHRQTLSFLPARAPNAAPANRGTMLSVRRAGVYVVPGWPGRLRVTRVATGGVPLAWLGRIQVRPRSGSEQFQSGAGRPPRSLKKQFQAANVPAWARDGPLFYSGGQLLYVPGLGIDARVTGLPGMALMQMSWIPDPIPGARPPHAACAH